MESREEGRSSVAPRGAMQYQATHSRGMQQ